MRREVTLQALLTALLLFCTLGQGGDAPGTMLAVHGALIALWIVMVMRPPVDHRPDLAPAAAFAAFLGLALLGAVLAPYRYGAFTQVQELAAFTAVALLAARCGPRLTSRLALPVLAAASLQGTWVLVQRFALDIDRPAGTFFNTNHLGAWLAAALLLGLGAWEKTPARGALALRIGLALPALGGLLASTSRGAFLGLAAGAAWLVLSLWRRFTPRQRTALVVSVCLVGVVVGAILAQRFRTVDPYALYRVQIWKSSASMIPDRPWLGTGPGQFASTAQEHQFADGTPPLRYDRVFRRPHSDWLRVPCEFGLPAAAVLLLALILAARSSRNRERSGFDAGAVAALVALAAHGAVENLSERPALYLLAAALLGSLLARPAKRVSRLSAGVRSLICLALPAAFLVGDLAPYLAYRHGNEGDTEAALRFNPLQPYIRMRHAERTAGDGSELDLDRYVAARENAEAAVRMHPREGSLRLRLARIEALACRTLFRDEQARRRAAERYREAAEISRPSALIPLEEGEFLFGTSDFAGAVEAAGRAALLEPESPVPPLLEARAILQEGGGEAAERARKLLQQAVELESRHKDAPRQNEYTRLLLELDPDAVRWVGDRTGP